MNIKENRTISDIKRMVRKGYYTSNYLVNRNNSDTEEWNSNSMKFLFTDEKTTPQRVLECIDEDIKKFVRLEKNLKELKHHYVLTVEELEKGGKDIMDNWKHKFQNFPKLLTKWEEECSELEWVIETNMNSFVRWYPLWKIEEYHPEFIDTVNELDWYRSEVN